MNYYKKVKEYWFEEKEESQLINLFVVGVLMVIASFLYPMARPLRLMGVMAIVIGIVPFLYGTLSEKKRHSRAKISEIDEMKGYEFERYIVFLLLNNGYQNVSDTGEGPDQGVDVRATKEGVTYGIQCKRWKKRVGNKAVQEIHAGKDFYKLDRGIVDTNNYFTNSAKQLAKKLKIELCNRDDLMKMIEKIPISK